MKFQVYLMAIYDKKKNREIDFFISCHKIQDFALFNVAFILKAICCLSRCRRICLSSFVAHRDGRLLFCHYCLKIWNDFGNKSRVLGQKLRDLALRLISYSGHLICRTLAIILNFYQNFVKLIVENPLKMSVSSRKLYFMNYNTKSLGAL